MPLRPGEAGTSIAGERKARPANRVTGRDKAVKGHQLRRRIEATHIPNLGRKYHCGQERGAAHGLTGFDDPRHGGLPRKSIRLFAIDAAQSTLRRRLLYHASNLADKCGTERADRRRRHQIIGIIDLHAVIFVQDQP